MISYISNYSCPDFLNIPNITYIRYIFDYDVDIYMPDGS